GGGRGAGQGGVVAEGQGEQVVAPLAGGRGEVAGTGGVAAVGGGGRRGTGQAPGEPVVRQQDAGHPGGVGRFVGGEPAQLGDGEAGHRYRSRRLRPRGRPAQLGDQVGGGAGGAGVVPQQGGPDHLAGLVEADHAVLLAGDRDG